MQFHPEEILISATTNCNLKCPHCDIKQSKKVLSQASAKKFLKQCKEFGINRVGFTGGEPFLALDFLCMLTKDARDKDMHFDKIMTNAVWWKNKSELESALNLLHDAGYDGSICISVDSYHVQTLNKLLQFVKSAVSIFKRNDIISIACTDGLKEGSTKKKIERFRRLVKAHDPSVFIKVFKIKLSPIGKASKFKNGWDGKWFSEDYCKGPGNVFFVMPDGSVKPCCGYATDARMLTIGNIRKDSVEKMMQNARNNRFVSTVFASGLAEIRKRLERCGVKFLGKTSSHCYFCNHILNNVPKNILNRCLNGAKTAIAGLFIFSIFVGYLFAADTADVLKMSKDFKQIDVKVNKKIVLPKKYHEGLFYDGKDIWVSNGEGGKVWIVDILNGKVNSEITPPGTFTEAVTRSGAGSFYLTDWTDESLYKIAIENNKMSVEARLAFSPAHPAGLVWNGSNFFVITWKRGLGTKFDLLEIDENFKQIQKISIQKIEEPDQMAWDGTNLWITSWYDRKVYKIDISKREIVGSFKSPADMATGICWDGKYLWLTGTYADLYQIEVIAKEDSMKISSSAFKEGEMIPKKYAGDGENMSPPLSFSDVPQNAKSLALICDDPDAPMGTWVHWVLFNLSPDTKELPQAVSREKVLKNGAIQGVNGSRSVGYEGPYPPSGTHRYFFKLYALDTTLKLSPGIKAQDLAKSIETHILAQAQLMGRYKR